MKPTRFSPLYLVLAALLLHPLAARAITFTGDTKIAFNDSSFDGLDIVVSNCTLTVDGPHSFASLQVLQGGIVTHTAAATGTLPPVIFTVTGELHTLSSTNATMLTFSNIFVSSIVVRDLSATVVYTNGLDYQVTVQGNGTALLQLLPGSAIPDGSLNRVDYQYSGPFVLSGLTLTVTNNLLVQRGGSINVDGKGYGAGQGPGKGSSIGSPISGGGAGHGGNGGYGAGLDGIGAVYDSLQQPADKGSGGGGSINSGGAGGGAIKLVVGGALLVDGVLSANGSDAVTNRSGGGAGGSIWLNAQTLAGSGTISANGGSGELPYGGGAGGGRIALQTSINVFMGQTSAWGGNGYSQGGAGTIYTRLDSQRAQVLVDNAGPRGLTTFLQNSETFDLTAQGGAVLSLPGGLTLGNLLLRSNAWLSVSNLVPALINVSGKATIEEGGGITADSTGYPASRGRGAGGSSSYPVFTGGGGGYGGNGASGGGSSAYGGGSYGSLVAPTDPGSGGASYLNLGLGSAGGGAIRLQVAGILVLNGRISADGGAGVSDGSGGGSGGSIWLNVGGLAGGGVISANGGAGNGFGLYEGGGGGGGRISIQSGMNLFFGMLAARGGGGYARGGAGTVYVGFPGQPAIGGQLVVDNGGLAGTNTALIGLTTPAIDLVVRGAAVVTSPIQLSIGNLLIGSNSWIVASNQTLNAYGNVTIQAGGGIVADGGGYAANIGLGAGKYSPLVGGGYAGGGAGYGGYGGDGAGSSTSTLHTGGGIYGSVISPVDRGSGGGSAGYYSSSSGAGGGAFRLIVSRTLNVDGTITANGNAATTPAGGGGSGGSLWLTAGTFSGVGTISANGGDGNGVGGGGGGGRIAIEYATNAFAGILAARGGDGNNRGGAGTIYTRANNKSVGQLVVDNGGQPGTNTSWSQSATVDLTITGGATVTPPGSQTFGNLLIGPNSALLVSNQVLTVTGDATIQAGGGLIADGAGYGPAQGPGAGRYAADRSGTGSGGGGYGGNGASGASSPGVVGPIPGTGGATYGSLTTPTDRGSGGGGSSTDALGGGGGGAVRLSVTGALTVAGRISANGRAGAAGGAGGGSGGSVWLTAGTLSGSGMISANGGDGSGPNGGGGGGGRIAITSSVNAFNGMISAFGGGGYAWGGAGTIYTASSAPAYQRPPQVIVDNGGNLGTNTTWVSQVVFDLLIRGGGVAVPLSSQTVNSVLIASNSWMRLTNQPLTIISNVTVQAGGGIVADGAGFGAQGPGTGRFTNVVGYGYIGGGGGYGGYGASAGFGSLLTGGGTYGSLTTPTDRGSGGGSYTSGYGGLGGGAIRLTINGAMNLNGRLSAQGSPGGSPGAGGGSGGSIWLTAGALNGSGLISADGGDGNGLGGGGGGGRIALICGGNAFTGPVTAFGGAGGSGWGGAGTIYLAAKNQTSGQVLVDNGGRYGTNTLIASQSAPFNLTVRNGAGLYITSPSLLLSNLDIGPGGLLGLGSTPTNLSLTVLRDALIESGGELTLDGRGYVGMTGPGKGATLNAIGSGGGYGGKGGASSLQPGGPAYGSALQPTDPGSSGGFGYGAWTGGSEGGGALRLSVGRALTVNGLLSANGNAGLQDNAGGGSGGSIWVSAAVFTGTGQVQADGGDGELYGGGGGGGGRIAVYSPANLFGGLVSASGGNGFARGDDGTVYYSATFPPLAAATQSPAGTVTYAVANVDLTFDTALNPYTALASDVVVTTPAGVLPSGAVTVTAPSAATVRLSFPPQTAEGAYRLTFGAQLQSLYGQPLSQVYTGAFAIAWPVIQGTVTDSQNAPVAGVLVQPDGGLPPTYTDASGNYALKVLPSGDVSIVPAMNSLVFVPRSRSYGNVAAPLQLQDYLAVNSIAPTPSVQYQAASMVMNWQGIPGVTYQPLCSSNLVDWLPYGQPVVGTNGPAELALPYNEGPQMFFRLRASN